MELDQALEASMMGPFDIVAFAIAHHHDLIRGHCEIVRATFMSETRICFRNEDDIHDPWKGGYCAVLDEFDWEPLLDETKRQQVTRIYYRDFPAEPTTGVCENDFEPSAG